MWLAARMFQYFAEFLGDCATMCCPRLFLRQGSYGKVRYGSEGLSKAGPLFLDGERSKRSPGETTVASRSLRFSNLVFSLLIFPIVQMFAHGPRGGSTRVFNLSN